MSTDYQVLNLKSYIDSSDSDESVTEFLDGFLCPKNTEVESFLQNNAVDFTRKNLSITDLVVCDANIVGYFSLAVKTIRVPKSILSRNLERKVSRFGEYDRDSETYTLSAYLIAQLGKNYSIQDGNGITGKELLSLAESVLSQVQRMIGCGFIFLECEDRKALLDFYERHGYRQFDKRITEKRGIELLQYLKPF